MSINNWFKSSIIALGLSQVNLSLATAQVSNNLTAPKHKAEFVIVIGVDPIEWNFDAFDRLGIRNLLEVQVPYLREKFDSIGINLRVEKAGISQKLSELISRSTTVGLIWIGHGDRGVLKLFLTQYFLYKITLSKKSEIKVFKDGKSASFSNYEDMPEKVIKIYKNADEINPDYFEKAE